MRKECVAQAIIVPAAVSTLISAMEKFTSPIQMQDESSKVCTRAKGKCTSPKMQERFALEKLQMEGGNDVCRQGLSCVVSLSLTPSIVCK